MPKGLLHNFAAFNTAVHLSLSNTPSGFMSSSADKQPELSKNMSALMTGSVADYNGLDYPRSAPYIAGGSYDPFSTRPHNRYSPPRDNAFDAFGIDGLTSSRVAAPLYEGVASRSVNYHSASTYPGVDKVAYLSRDTAQRSTIDNKPSSRRHSQDSYGQRTGSPLSQGYTDYDMENHRRNNDIAKGTARYHTKRRPFNQDEFDGPSQYLPLPLPQQDHSRAQALPDLPIHLEMSEQDEILKRANDILSECAFHFVAKYQFPVPLERDKPRVRGPSDREWTEWAYLLKRLATKRRIPARVLFDNQIKQLVTTLENSIAARQSANKDAPNPKRKARDDRYILQLLSSGAQVAKILMDSLAMEQLDELYARTEAVILDRRRSVQATKSPR